MITSRDRDDILISTVIRLIKHRAISNLQNVVSKTHAADSAHWFPYLRPNEKSILINLLFEQGQMGEVMSELNREDRSFVVQEFDAGILADVFHTMPADDLGDILADLPEETAQELLKLIKGKTSEHVEQLLQFEEKTAGYIMTPNFLALTEETTAAAAMARIRELADIEMVFYVYVVDQENQLKGVISLRQLVTTKPDTPLRDLMTTRVFSVHPNTSQEESHML